MALPLYYINLDSRPDREVEFCEEARRAGQTNLTRVPACNGADPDYTEGFAAGKFPGGFRNAREVACWQSHVKAIEMAVAACETAPKTEFVAFAEDDSLFVEDFKRRLDVALKNAPKKATFLYAGYLRYHFTKVTKKGDTWSQLAPVYGLHFYLIRRSALAEVLAFFKKADRPIDDYVTACYPHDPGYYCANQPLAYQRISSTSDITGWADTVNPFNRQIMNPLHLRYLWDRSVHPAETIRKVLHILPGQRLFFKVPPDWEVTTWTYWDEIHDYKKYAKIVPFAWWVIYYHGGLAFPDELSPWLDKHWLLDDNGVKMINRPDVIVARKGDPELTKLIEAKIRTFNPGFEGGRWGQLLPEAEVAPDLFNM